MYNTLSVVGAQWGDEGKGKMTDYFAQNANVVVRFAGGDNAGHVINFNGTKHKVTIIPSGIFTKNCINIIGNGCVVNVKNLCLEYKEIAKSNVELGKLFISERAHVIFQFHQDVDAFQEEARGENKIGTTKRGIGPAYQSKVDRSGIRMCDFKDKNFKEKLEFNYKNAYKFMNKEFNNKEFEDFYNEQVEFYNSIQHMVIDAGTMLFNLIKEGKKVLFEGAQGALLDIDHGTYPFVTSSNTSANNAAVGSGIPAKMISEAIGVVKAYSTRVGAGGFPTELLNEIGDGIRQRGNEYGSNTKRPRRVGWLDGVALKHAIRTSGLDSIFITLLDVLSGIDELKICTKYTLNGKEIESLPPLNYELEQCKAVYTSTPGWSDDITSVKNKNELPQNAIKYLEIIENICDIKIKGFSVGPDRTQTVLFENNFQ